MPECRTALTKVLARVGVGVGDACSRAEASLELMMLRPEPWNDGTCVISKSI